MALILSRLLQESIRLYTSDGEIDITVVEIVRGKVRFAFKAPEKVKILRSELIPRDQSFADIDGRHEVR